MKLFVLQSCGYKNVRFTRKYLYNKLYAKRRKDMKEGDAESSIAYQLAKQDGDPMFYFKYDIDDERRLKALLWPDSQSRADHENFGDALVFDSTYSTNAYKKPLVVLTGIIIP